jgi:hypothetical protein
VSPQRLNILEAVRLLEWDLMIRLVALVVQVDRHQKNQTTRTTAVELDAQFRVD